MSDTIYILTRTSRRPQLFARLRETIKALTWPGPIVHMVHSDDPRDTYVEGDIIIRGESLRDIRMKRRSGPYNLYNNRLLDAIPGDGWAHFMDDDDEYAAPDVFECLLADADPEKIMVGHVHRGKGVIFPARWGEQGSFQTEIPIMRVEIARQSRWPASKGGDHTYNRPLVRKYGVKWMDDVLISTTNEGKGNGERRDAGGEAAEDISLPLDTVVYAKPALMGAWLPREMPLREALEMEADAGALITYRGVTVEYVTVDAPDQPVEFDKDLPKVAGFKRPLHQLIDDAVALGLGSPETLKKHSRVWLMREIRRGQKDGFKEYQRVGIVEIRPYIEGEDLTQVQTFGRTAQKGDVIERRKDNRMDMRLIPHDDFARLYREVEDI